MVPQNFRVFEKLGFCSKYWQNFSGCSFARARIFLLVHACSFFGGGSFLKVLVARKANFCQCSCSQRKTLCSHARKDHSIPLLIKSPIFTVCGTPT